MWYLGWIIGLAIAIGFAVVNGMWLEKQDAQNNRNKR